MKLRAAALALLAGSVAWSADAGLLQVKRVYLLPMTAGLDQYLANELAEEGVFEVVTDPEDADAVFTDRLGPSFEEQFLTLYRKPVPAAAPEQDDKAPAKEAAPAGAAKKPAAADPYPSAGDRPDTPPRVSTFGRGKGNVFLVDRATRRVLWSEYARARRNRPDDLNRLADRVVGRLEDSLKHLRSPRP